MLTTDSGFNVLLDCGLYQGEGKDTRHLNEHWGFEPMDVHAVCLSHAHIDHSGLLPKLYKDGFRGKIYATQASIGRQRRLETSAKTKKHHQRAATSRR